MQHGGQNVFGNADFVFEDIAYRGLCRNGVERNVVGTGAGQVQQSQLWCERHVPRPVHGNHGIRVGEFTFQFFSVFGVCHVDCPIGLEKFRNQGETAIVVDVFYEEFQGVMFR